MRCSGPNRAHLLAQVPGLAGRALAYCEGGGLLSPGWVTLAGERVHRKVHEPRSCTETPTCDAGFRALIPD